MYYYVGCGVLCSNGNIVLFFVFEVENVIIEGVGMIDGNGVKFFIGCGDNIGLG